MNYNKILISVSNHPVSGWSDEQKKDWDEIKTITFPNVGPRLSADEVWDMSETLSQKITDITHKKESSKSKVYIHIQGESSLVANVLFRLEGMRFVFPTTERNVKISDGKEIRSFNFVQWRGLR